MKSHKRQMSKPARARPKLGRSRKGTNSFLGGNRTRVTTNAQHKWTSGVSVATRQVRDQIGMMDQGAWTRVGEAAGGDNYVYTLGGIYLGTDTSFTSSVMDTVDVDFCIDFAASITLVLGSAFSAFTHSLNVMPQFATLFLPHCPQRLMVPGVLVQCIQCVATRLGNVETVTGAGSQLHELQPGYGVVGALGDLAIHKGGRYVIRIRFYKRYDFLPAIWFYEAALNAGDYLIGGPLMEWERRWRLRVPRQRAWDRIGLAIDPMPNAYTFSFVPSYPNTFLFETVAGSPLTWSLDYVLPFDPNEVTEVTRPLAGVVAQQRRRALGSLALGGPAMRFEFWATQPCRVYVRIVDVSGNLVPWSVVRSSIDSATVIVIASPPGLVTSNGVGFHTMEQAQLWARRSPQRRELVAQMERDLGHPQDGPTAELAAVPERTTTDDSWTVLRRSRTRSLQTSVVEALANPGRSPAPSPQP